MGRYNLVSLKNFTQLPASHNVCDATILLNAADNDLGNELAIAVYEQFAMLQNTLIFASIDHDEMPFRIGNEDFAFDGGWKFDGLGGVSIKGQVSIKFFDSLAENRIFFLGTGQSILQTFNLLGGSKRLLGI